MERQQKLLFLGKESKLDPGKQPSEMLKDLVLNWFLTTQVPLILQDGNLPEWFHGFITRKQAEELLKDGGLGCFLVRLNERSFGYILSYRGKDRSRHFVISCQRSGHYAISGDTQTHQSLAELIGYYQRTDIEPFNEKLTMPCSKQEETSVYDEISLDQQSSLKQRYTAGAPVLTRQVSGSSSTTTPAKENVSNQPTKARQKLQAQQKSLSKDKPDFSPEAPDDAPPVPARSRLLLSESFEEDLNGEGNSVSSELKKHHLDSRSPEVPKNTYKDIIDDSQKPEGPAHDSSSSSRKKKSTLFAMAKQSERLLGEKINLIETAPSETIYSEIGPDQDQSSWMRPEPLSGQSSLNSLKKATLSSPASTPPKLSPKLPNKPKTSMELQGSQPPFTTYSTSLVVDKDPQKPNHPKALPDSPKETMYGQINKMKSHQSAVSTCDKTSNAYEQVPFGWLKGITHEHDLEKSAKASATKPKQTYDRISPKSGLKMQSYAENPYAKIPDHLTKGSPSKKQIPTMENTYEQVSFSPAKGTESKPSQKRSDKPRRFFFADNKTKF